MYKQIGEDESFSDILSRFETGLPPRIDTGPGWGGLIRECHEKLVAFDPNYKVSQIKEKFGGLRYYFLPSNPAYTRSMYDKILLIEKQSFLICEICGSDAKLKKTKDGGWLKTLCNEHAYGEIYIDAADKNLYGNGQQAIDDAKRLTLYPIAIRESRYGGTYEGGKWHAIGNCDSDTWSMDYFEYLHGDDDAAVEFWWNTDYYTNKIGIGDTPNDALADLFKKNFI